MSDDPAEAFARASRRSMRIKIGVLGVVVLSPLVWVLWKKHEVQSRIDEHEEAYRKEQELSEDELARLRTAIPEAERSLAATAQAFAAATTPELLGRVVETDARCPSGFRAPDPAAATSYVKGFSSSETSRRIPVSAPGAPIDAGLGRARVRLQSAAEHLAAGEPTRNDLEAARDATDVDGHQVFVVGIATPPTVLGDSYEPGTIRGTAYVYSYAQHAVICAATLDVQNSAGVDVTYSARADLSDQATRAREATLETLARDMEMQLQFAIAAHLHATQ